MSLDKKKLEEFLINDVDVETIALKLGVKKATVQKSIERNFSDLVEKKRKDREDNIALMYKEGKTAAEIAIKLNMKKSTVENYFRLERFIELKPIRESNLKEGKKFKREMKMIMNRENNQILSTRNLIKMNRHSYKYVNGKLVYDNKVGARPWDVPKTYSLNI